MLLEVKAGNPGLAPAPYKDIFIFPEVRQGLLVHSRGRRASLIVRPLQEDLVFSHSQHSYTNLNPAALKTMKINSVQSSKQCE